MMLGTPAACAVCAPIKVKTASPKASAMSSEARGGVKRRPYASVAPAVLPHVAGRPMTLHRFPEGVDGPSFFQARAPSHPPWVRVQRMHSFRSGKDEFIATAGDVIVVEPGTSHKFWNAGYEEARFRCEVRPALQFEQLLETMYSLAADGKTNKKGMPNPLQLAVIAKARARSSHSGSPKCQYSFRKA